MLREMEFSTYHEPIARALRAALAAYYDKWLEISCRDQTERPLYLSTIEEKRITVVVLTSVLIEHTINFYLGTKCDTARFQELERKPLIRKWTTIPTEFVPAYVLGNGTALFRDLDSLIKRRNAIVHHKSKISIDGDNRHQGNQPQLQLDENAFIESCASLPFRLVQHLLNNDPDAFVSMSSVSTACGAAIQELNRARYRLDYLNKIPKQLVAEIIQQGYSPERAMFFAALLGPVPPRWPDGSIPVRRFGEVIAVLEPLKSFPSSDFILDLSSPSPAEGSDEMQKRTEEPAGSKTT